MFFFCFPARKLTVPAAATAANFFLCSLRAPFLFLSTFLLRVTYFDFDFHLCCVCCCFSFCNLNLIFSFFLFTFLHTVCAWHISFSPTFCCCWCSSAWSIISLSGPTGQNDWCARWPPSWNAACRCGPRICICHGRSCSARIHRSVPQTCFFLSFEIFLIGEMQLGASLYVSFWFEVVFLDALLPSHTVSNVFAARQKWKLNFV